MRSSAALAERNLSWSTDGALEEVTEAGEANPGERQMDRKNEEQILHYKDFLRLKKSGHCFTSCPEVCTCQRQGFELRPC